MYSPPFYIFTPEMKQYRCLLLILLAQSNAFAQHPWGPAVPGPMPAGDIGYFEEETSVVWTIDLSSQGRRHQRGTRRQVERWQTMETFSFDSLGRLTERCEYRSLNPRLVTVELPPDGSAPSIVRDSLADRSRPQERNVFDYSDSTLESFIPIFRLEQETDSDGLETRYFYNDHGCVSRVERDWDSLSMSVTVFDDYEYDRYGNWTSRKRYSIVPGGPRRLSGSDRRRYIYR